MTRQFTAIPAIPGQNDPHLARLASEAATFDMATEGLRGLPFPAFLEAFEAALEARPDIQPTDLEEFSNRVRRIAWKKGA